MSTRWHSSATREQGTNLVSALFLSVVLHGSWLLLSEESAQWEGVTTSRSGAGRRVHLNAALRQTQQPASAIPSDQPLLAPPPVAANGQVPTVPGKTSEAAENGSSVPGQTGAERRATRGEYLPRSALSTPPVPLREIAVPWPGDLAVSGRMVAVFALHIDEFGIVREILNEEQVSLPAVEEAVRKAFSGARFAPGRIEGRPVRSRIRIEISFESGPAPQAPAIISARKEL